MRTVPIALAALALLAPVAAPAQEEPPVEPAAAIRVELVKLNRTLKEMSELLEAHLQGQQLDLAFKRLDLSSARIARIEQTLRSSQAELQLIEDQRAREEAELKFQVAQAEEDIWLELFLEEAERKRELRESNARDLELRISELQNELTKQRREFEDWQHFVDERLTDQ